MAPPPACSPQRMHSMHMLAALLLLAVTHLQPLHADVAAAASRSRPPWAAPASSHAEAPRLQPGSARSAPQTNLNATHQTRSRRDVSAADTGERPAAAGGSPLPFGSRDEIFVAGCGHSGTSIMERLIGAHPAIYRVGEETCALCKIGRGINVDESGDEFERAARRLAELDRRCTEAGARRWVEKTPRHVYYLEKLFLLRPRARVVLSLRDGRDVANSFKRRYRHNFAFGVMRWVNETKATLAWRSHPQVLLVRYEDLVKRTEATLDRVFAFLQEAYSLEETLSFFNKKVAYQTEGLVDVAATVPPQNHEQLRSWQMNQPLFDGSGRWRAADGSGLSADEREVVRRLAGQLLIDTGYALDLNW